MILCGAALMAVAWAWYKEHLCALFLCIILFMRGHA